MRHGESIGNIWEPIYNNDDLNFLSLTGTEQAKMGATSIAQLDFPINFYMCSGMTRAKQTLMTIKQSLRDLKTPINAVIPEFNERQMGLHGSNNNNIKYESDDEFHNRIIGAIDKYLISYLKKGNVLLVCHSLVINEIQKTFGHTPVPLKGDNVPHCDPIVLTYHHAPNINDLLKR